MVRYAITDRSRSTEDESKRQVKLLRQAEEWASNEVDFIQLREKDLKAGALAILARKLVDAIRSHKASTRVLINSRVDIAIAAEAAGVHLTSAPGSLTPGQIRLLYRDAGLPEPVVSISCHKLTDVVLAREKGASLILFGPVFEKRVDSRLVSGGVGLELLRAACAKAAPVPVLALGGVSEANVSACLATGAAGIAAIRLFTTV